METIKLESIEALELGNTIQLIGMVMDDTINERTLILNVPEESLRDDIQFVDMTHEDWKALLRQTDIKEVVILEHDDAGVKKAIVRKTARQIDSSVSWNVFRRDNYTCRYCGKDDVPLTVDHLVLWEVGGPSIEENLVSSCRKCNRLRGNMGYEVWLRSKEYQRMSKNLAVEVKILNSFILQSLKDIPLRLHIPSRGSSSKKKRGGR